MAPPAQGSGGALLKGVVDLYGWPSTGRTTGRDGVSCAGSDLEEWGMASLDLDLLVGSLVVLVAVIAARVSSRVGLPALLLFLLVGIAMGNSGLGFKFSDATLAHNLGFAALVLILIEGGLTTKWSDIRPSIGPAAMLAFAGTLVSIGLVTLFAHFVLGIPLAIAALLGAVTAPTDAAAVFSVLRGIPLPSGLRATLEAESGLNDAPAVLLVATFTSMATHHAVHQNVGVVAGLVVEELIGGALLGLILGAIAVYFMPRVALPSSGLYPLTAVAWAVMSYGIGVQLHISGFAAVYVTSVLMGNGKLPHRHAVRSFSEGIGWVSQIGLFVMLGLLADPGRITWRVVLVGVVAGLFLTVVARPLSVIASTAWFKVPWRNQVFLSWAGLRGAVPIILATVPMSEHVPHADDLFDVVLVFVLVFTALQAPTLPWLARRLGLVDPEAMHDVDIEAAPLDRMGADLLQVHIPEGSHMAGVTIAELRMPRNAVVSLVIRGEQRFAPAGRDVLRVGDDLLIVTPSQERKQIETRLTEIGRGGRLARWLGTAGRGTDADPPTPRRRVSRRRV